MSDLEPIKDQKSNYQIKEDRELRNILFLKAEKENNCILSN